MTNMMRTLCGALTLATASCLAQAADVTAPQATKSDKSIGIVSISASEPLPIRFVEDKLDADRKEKRESDNFEAQQKSAEAAVVSASATVRQADYARWALWVGIAGTLVTFFGSIFVIATFIETRKTATAAIDSAKAAEDALSLARDSQRAWLAMLNYKPGSKHLVTPTTPGAKPTVAGYSGHLVFRNSGQTVALHCEIGAEAAVVPISDSPPTLTRKEEGLIPTIVLPGGDIPANPVFFKLEELVGISENRLKAYLHALLTYRDIHNSTIERRTEVYLRMYVVGWGDDESPSLLFTPELKERNVHT